MFRYANIIYPVVALVLAWMIDCPVEAISLISVTLAVTWGIRALPDMYD